MMGLVEPPVAKTYITEETMQKHPQLRPVVASTSSSTRRSTRVSGILIPSSPKELHGDEAQ